MGQHAVVIAGCGPTGMMLAAELALAGVDAVVVERRATQDVDGTRALGLQARTLEVFDQRGVVDRFLSAGTAAQVQSFAGVRLDISDFPSRRNHGLSLRQRDIERILLNWIEELGVPILREREVTGFTQDGSGVDVQLSGGEALRSQYLAGCDGGRSVVRKAAEIEFAGWAATTSWLMAEVEMTETPEFGVRPGGGIAPSDRGAINVVLVEAGVDHPGLPGIDDVRAALIASDGTDYGAHSLTWSSRFTDMSRQAAAYRRGRVVLAGDSAHVHPPQGGQGISTGVQDAVNIGWKLAQVVRGRSPDSLLDTYHAERHPVGARILQRSMAQITLDRRDERHQALRSVVAELLRLDEPRRQMAGSISGLDIRYDLGEGHPLLGRRMPDLDLTGASDAGRVFELLHTARPVLLDLGAAGALDVTPWSDRVRHVVARCDGPWELPVLGAVPAPAAVLIRPDGHVAWVGEGTDAGLREALTTWFGAP